MIGLWCNGSTTGFGSVCLGSNPGSSTNITNQLQGVEMRSWDNDALGETLRTNGSITHRTY